MSVDDTSNTPLDELDKVSNQGWEDLNKLNSDANHVFVIAHQVVPFLKDVETIANVKKSGRYEELTSISSNLNDNLKKAKEELNAIHSKHANKTGDNTSPDELLECISIGQEYSQWITTYQNVIIPTVKSILEIIENANKQETDEK